MRRRAVLDLKNQFEACAFLFWLGPRALARGFNL
jgi:hypothetical protein